ncbi:hypothetical protein H0H81_008007 [Sphagnurus paluster]|uniref:Uncharacterized protein n=1 Tax=Sphagnurus paluster TaxID=117069 RepID=A0A9P7KKD8_9AGAR|nr:hypothetical protein H0H81_008007 [Sphagnurus paluster]
MRASRALGATLRHSFSTRAVTQSARSIGIRFLLQNPSFNPSRRLVVGTRAYSAQNASRATSVPDQNRADLFYHLVQPPTPLSRDKPAHALSFLESPPANGSSCTVLGWLPTTGSQAGLNDFVENRKFRDILHRAIQDGLRKDVDDIQRNGALQLTSGWMHIHDDRNIPPLGRIGDPDDIIGTVLVEDGKILPETYAGMPSYRICTADGPTQLTPGLAQHLHTLLVEEAQKEKDEFQ